MENNKTLYKKEDLIKIVASMLTYYESSKDKSSTIKAADELMHKIKNGGDLIELEPKFIEEILFVSNEDGTKTIVKDLFLQLRAMRADMQDVSFENVHISGYYFNGFKNVEINIQSIPNCDISNTFLEGVKVTGSLDGAKISGTNFSGYIGQLVLDPQKVQDKNLYKARLNGITIDGSFDGVYISGMTTKGSKGDIIINPQKVQDKNLLYINFENVQIVGEYNEETSSYGDACLDGCKLHNTSFKGCLGNVIINLDKIYPYISVCDLSGCTIQGTTDNLEFLYHVWYEDEKGEKVYLTKEETPTVKNNPKGLRKILSLFNKK